MTRSFTELEQDALRELCNMGAGRAVGALSQLLGGRAVMLELPRAEPLRRSALAAELGEGAWTAVEFHVQGEAAGLLVWLMPQQAALRLAGQLLGEPPAAFGPLEKDALSEVGNILASSFLDALARVTGTWLQPSVPRWVEGGPDEVVAALRFLDGDEPGLLLEAQWTARGAAGLSGRVWMMPEEASVETLLSGMGA